MALIVEGFENKMERMFVEIQSGGGLGACDLYLSGPCQELHPSAVTFPHLGTSTGIIPPSLTLKYYLLHLKHRAQALRLAHAISHLYSDQHEFRFDKMGRAIPSV